MRHVNVRLHNSSFRLPLGFPGGIPARWCHPSMVVLPHLGGVTPCRRNRADPFWSLEQLKVSLIDVDDKSGRFHARDSLTERVYSLFKSIVSLHCNVVVCGRIASILVTVCSSTLVLFRSSTSGSVELLAFKKGTTERS